MKAVGLLVTCLCFATGCAYVGTWARQSHYRQQLKRSPGLGTAKHLLDESTFFVFGKVAAPLHGTADQAMAVVAFSSTERLDELVDASHAVRADSFYGLHLPAGAYTLVALVDRDQDGYLAAHEAVASRRLVLPEDAAERVVPDIDLQRVETGIEPPAGFRLEARRDPLLAESHFFPKGTLRTLDDPLFSPAIASLGMYAPASFLERAPMMFYALEEDLGYKVPVVFVHGIGGSARDFETIVGRLDRSRYCAWFFHYPSGGDLNQLSALFYEIFLSGNVMPRRDVGLVIVAHSMGGLVAREALNRYRGEEREVKLEAFVTIASPLQGHPAVVHARRAPVVLPSWRNLDPDSAFVARLHRKPLPEGTGYYLFTASGGMRRPWGEPTDGVVPLSSQLSVAAVREAHHRHDFAATHQGVLRDPGAVDRIVAAVESVRTPYPDDHIREIERGGYDIALGAGAFSATERFVLARFARYLDALVEGRLDPALPYQRQFVDECRGLRKPESPLALTWLRFDRAHRERWGDAAP